LYDLEENGFLKCKKILVIFAIWNLGGGWVSGLVG